MGGHMIAILEKVNSSDKAKDKYNKENKSITNIKEKDYKNKQYNQLIKENREK